MRDEDERRTTVKRFALRLMKEVVAHQRYGGSLEDAIDGSILFISNLLKIDERELRSYLREQSKTNDVAP